MKVTKYNLMLNKNRHPTLIAEQTVSYGKYEYFDNSESIAEMFVDVYKADKQAEEHVWILCLNSDTKPTGIFEVSHGSLCEAMVDMRAVFSRALLTNARAIIMCHNHPSGNINPSKEDYKVYHRLKEAGEIMNVELLDFIIIGENKFYSFSREE